MSNESCAPAGISGSIGRHVHRHIFALPLAFGLHVSSAWIGAVLIGCAMFALHGFSTNMFGLIADGAPLDRVGTLEEQIREVGDNLPGADGIEMVDEMSLRYPDPGDEFRKAWFRWMERYGTRPITMPGRAASSKPSSPRPRLANGSTWPMPALAQKGYEHG